MLQDKGDRGSEIREALFPRSALTIRARDLSAVRDVPGAVLLHNRGEFVAQDRF